MLALTVRNSTPVWTSKNPVVFKITYKLHLQPISSDNPASEEGSTAETGHATLG